MAHEYTFDEIDDIIAGNFDDTDFIDCPLPGCPVSLNPGIVFNNIGGTSFEAGQAYLLHNCSSCRRLIAIPVTDEVRNEFRGILRGPGPGVLPPRN